MNPRQQRKMAYLLSLILIVPALFALTVRAQQDPYERAIERADNFTRQGQFVEALAAAQAAINLNPNRFQGHYYAAFALYRRGLLDEAEPIAKRALELAPAESRPDAQRLVDAITKRRTFAAQVQAADQALNDGLIAKAAAAYTKAWEAVPESQDIGLKAAQLWSERLGNHVAAAPILSAIVASPTDPQVVPKATEMLQRLQPLLRGAFDEQLQNGQRLLAQGQLDDALKALRLAALAQPDRQEPHLHLARIYAKRNDWPSTRNELSQMLKKGRVSISDISSYPEFDSLSREARFLAFIGDALGEDAAKAFEASLRSRAAMTAYAERAKRDGFVQIPAGEFLMGSENGDGDEKPPHRVRISQWFEMGQYEVTQAMWQAVMGSNPSNFKGQDLPIENVSWDEVQGFISRLNARNDGYVYRLPTEAEWEYACRAGTTGDYAGSLDAMAWYSSNSGSRTHPVGQKQPNAWGLYDMHGNVWEWCQDWYGGYPTGAVTDPKGAESGSGRVTRGGSWINSAANCRSALRGISSPGYRFIYLGFRLVRTAK
jgi:formylglycine-generating enzyme required for sulfatase activity